MDTIKILPKSDRAIWDYDEEADVLYISIGEPMAAVAVDIGDGTVMRYTELDDRLVGITVIGLKQRFARELNNA